MINPQRKFKLHARQPLGLCPPGIGPSIDLGSEPGRFAMSAVAIGGAWHPYRGACHNGDPEQKKSALFNAWSVAGRVRRIGPGR